MSQHADELRKLAFRLEEISTKADSTAAAAADIVSMESGQKELVLRVEELLRIRKRRERVFMGYDIFGEPAWYMLLDLFLMTTFQAKVDMTSACIASGAPTTTALRYLKTLVDTGLVERIPDQHDKRKVFVRCTETGMDLIRRTLA